MVIKRQTKSKSESRNYRCISLFICLLHAKVPVKVPEDRSEGRVCPSIKFEFMSTNFRNHGTGFLGPNQTNNSFGTQSNLKLANSSFEFADELEKH